MATADVDGGSGAAPLLLGVAGEPFSFERDSPCALSWCSCVAVGGPPTIGGGAVEEGAEGGNSAQVDDVAAFITEAVTTRRRAGKR